MKTATTYTLRIGRQGIFPADSIAEASAIYARERDASGLGFSRFPEGRITPGNLCVSYNGKVWASSKHVSGAAPVFDPFQAEAV